MQAGCKCQPLPAPASRVVHHRAVLLAARGRRHLQRRAQAARCRVDVAPALVPVVAHEAVRRDVASALMQQRSGDGEEASTRTARGARRPLPQLLSARSTALSVVQQAQRHSLDKSMQRTRALPHHARTWSRPMMASLQPASAMRCRMSCWQPASMCVRQTTAADTAASGTQSNACVAAGGSVRCARGTHGEHAGRARCSWPAAAAASHGHSFAQSCQWAAAGRQAGTCPTDAHLDGHGAPARQRRRAALAVAPPFWPPPALVILVVVGRHLIHAQLAARQHCQHRRAA